MRPSRYHPLLVTLHWLLAFLIVANLVVGFFDLSPRPNYEPQKLVSLRWHMAVGMAILALMALRFATRLWTAKPPHAATGHPLLDRMAEIAHYGFYALVLLMAGTGFTTALLAGLPDIVFGGSGAPLPADLAVYPPRVMHGLLALLLTALIVVHLAAALYHHFVLQDGLLRRMLYGKRA